MKGILKKEPETKIETQKTEEGKKNVPVAVVLAACLVTLAISILVNIQQVKIENEKSSQTPTKTEQGAQQEENKTFWQWFAEAVSKE